MVASGIQAFGLIGLQTFSLMFRSPWSGASPRLWWVFSSTVQGEQVLEYVPYRSRTTQRVEVVQRTVLWRQQCFCDVGLRRIKPYRIPVTQNLLEVRLTENEA